jgi:hypothetical protein
MRAGSREAPITTTVRGSSIGRSDSAVARRRRVSAAATPSIDGVSESSTSTQPMADFDRTSNPESRNTSSIAALSKSAVASKRLKPWATAIAASRSSRSVARPLPCHRSSTANAASATPGVVAM